MTHPFQHALRPIETGDPEWCTFDHAADDQRDDLVLHLGDDHVDGTVRQLLNAHPRRSGRSYGLPDEGTVGTPNLMVRHDVELTTWQQAAELARTIARREEAPAERRPADPAPTERRTQIIRRSAQFGHAVAESVAL